MRKTVSAEHTGESLRASLCAVLVCALFCGSADAATASAPKSRYAALNCEQLRVEYLQRERGLLLDKSGAKMPGVEDAAGARQAGANAGEPERSAAVSDALAAMDLLSRVYIAKRCDPKDAQKSRTLAPNGEISTFAPMADVAEGRRDYKNRCAMCHGAEGKGGGWFAQYLTIKPPVLSQLKKNAGGAFPMAHLYDTIDGRQDVAVHGPREMPVWGANYRNEARRSYESFVGEPAQPENSVRARIYALLKYIYQFQE